MRFNIVNKSEKENCLDFSILDDYTEAEVRSFLNNAVALGKYYTIKHYLDYFEYKYGASNEEFKGIVLLVFADNIKYCIPAPKCCFSEDGKISNFATLPNKNRIELFLYITEVYPIVYSSCNIYYIIKTIEETNAWDMFYYFISRIKFFFDTYKINFLRLKISAPNEEMDDIINSHLRFYDELISMIENSYISDDTIIRFIKSNDKYLYGYFTGCSIFKFIRDILCSFTDKQITSNEDNIPDRCKLLEFFLTRIEPIGEHTRYCGYGPDIIRIMKDYKGPNAKDTFKLIFKYCCQNNLIEDFSYEYIFNRNYNDYIKAICECKEELSINPEWALVSAIVSRNTAAFENLLKAGYGYGLTNFTDKTTNPWKIIDEYHYDEFHFIAAKYGYYEDSWKGKYCFCSSNNPVTNAFDVNELITKLKNKELSLSEVTDEYDRILYSNASDEFNKCYGNCLGHYIVKFGTKEELNILLNAGYDIEKKNLLNISALELAVILDKAEIVEMLIKAGASIQYNGAICFAYIDFFHALDIVSLAICHLSKNVLKSLMTLTNLFDFSKISYKEYAVRSMDREIMDMFKIK